ncbi:MAG: TRAP transporter substrate-binding protein DctP [Desulfamplus sp.]|nr:TRAP transporter substrate-binding protein DctP [Desulfamplus sp.]
MVEKNMISRRDMLRLANKFGWTSLFLAATSMSSPMTLAELANAAESINKKRKNPRKTLTYAITIAGKTLFQINGFGYFEFIRDIEARTDGEIRIEFIPGSEICNEMTCVKKAMQGIVDIYSSSIQNAAGVAEYFNVLNFPYLFPNRASQHHFFYHPKSQRLLREPLTKHHGLILLFTHCRLRGFAMGKKWKDKPDIKSIDDIAGPKIRVTASKFGNKALKLIGVDGVPLDWNATLNALKFGLVDGMETWEAAVAGMSFEQPDIISQFVDLHLFSGNTHAAIRSSVFDSLTPELQSAIMESAYFTQIWGQLAGEASLINMVGASTPQMPRTIFSDQKIRYIRLSETELKRIEQMCSPEFNPKAWEEWCNKLNLMAGNIDIYQEIFKIAREISPDTLAENIAPRRWWKK